MAIGVDVLEWGRERARAGPWRGDGQVAYLTPTSHRYPPSEEFLRRCLDQLVAKGYGRVITSALAPAEQASFFAVGFEEHERLRLLSHDLSGIPARAGVASRPALPADHSAVLAIDASAFPPFWQLDSTGLDEALGATPSTRFRVISDRARGVVGYSVCGRSRRQGFVQRLAVDPDHRGHGLGRSLVVDGLRWMRRWGVEKAVVNTQQDNGAAYGLYRSLGFREEPWGLSVLRCTLIPR